MASNSSISGRIKEISEHYNITKPIDFAKKTGFSHQTATNYLEGRTPTAENLSIIQQSFEKINPEWLLTGRGEMLREVLPVATPAPLGKGIPLIPLDAIAGKGTELLLSVEGDRIEERYIIPEFDRVKPDYLIRTRGSSMSPKYNSGDILAIKNVPLEPFIQWNKPYVVETASNGVMVKRIKKSPEPEHWQMVSDNDKYPPFDVPLSDIRSIALVVGVIRLE